MLSCRWVFCALLPLMIACSGSWAQTTRDRKQLPAGELNLLAGSYNVLLESYVTPLDPAELIKASVQGMLRETDPDHGEYLSEAEWQEFSHGAAAGTGSLGMEVQRRDGVLILGPLAGGPAYNGGLRFGDQLRTVNGQPVGGRTVTQVLTLLKGPVGSVVMLGVYRPAEDHVLTFAATRSVVYSPSPTLTVLPENLRLLRLPRMAPEHLNAAFKMLLESWRAEKFSGLVIDLRGNQGGLVESSIAFAAAFLPSGSVIASTAGRGAANNRTYRAVVEDYKKGILADPVAMLPQEVRAIPLVILIDGQTSSGAEIALAAFRDARRATLVGRPTFGRGSIQTITPITGYGAIKYTSAYWVSPQGRSIDRSPIQPDVFVEVKDGEDDLAAAATAMKQLIGGAPKPNLSPGCPGWVDAFRRAGFPAVARDAGATDGRLMIEFTLSPSGRVVEPRIVQSSNPVFDAPALETARAIACVGGANDIRVRFAVDYRLK